MQGRRLVLTTTNKMALDAMVGPTEALEIIGKPYDIEQIVAAVAKALGVESQLRVPDQTGREREAATIDDRYDGRRRLDCAGGVLGPAGVGAGVRGVAPGGAPAIALVLWVLGRLVVGWSGLALFPSWVAVLDIGLVFAVFKGDIRLT